jgi:hypothetical protein
MKSGGKMMFDVEKMVQICGYMLKKYEHRLNYIKICWSGGSIMAKGQCEIFKMAQKYLAI